MRIFDITRSLYPGMPVYPGSPETIFEPIGQLPKDRSISTKMTIGSHAGTHVDAPIHVLARTSGVDAYPLERFMGKAVVLDLTNIASVITDNSLKTSFKNFKIRFSDFRNAVILLKTKNSLMDWLTFHEDFVALDESAAQYLVSIQPKLIGIDGPSIKKFRVSDQTHQLILSKNIPIIEWLDLSQVKTGVYQFIGFPLALENLDGSPLRAVLVK